MADPMTSNPVGDLIAGVTSTVSNVPSTAQAAAKIAELLSEGSAAAMHTAASLQSSLNASSILSAMGIDVSNKQAEVNANAATAAGNLAATETAGKYGLQEANKAASTVTGDDITDPNSRIYKEMQISNAHVDAAQANLESYMKKDQMTIADLFTKPGDYLDATFIHTKERDLSAAQTNSSIAALAQSNIHDIHDRFTGAVQRNTAAADLLTAGSAADSATVAAVNHLNMVAQAQRAAVDMGYKDIQTAVTINSEQFSIQKDQRNSQITGIMDVARLKQEDTKDNLMLIQTRLAQANEARIEAANLNPVQEQSIIGRGLAAIGRQPLDPVQIKDLKSTADGKFLVNTLMGIAAQDAENQQNPGRPLPLVSSPGVAAMLENKFNVRLLAKIPAATALNTKLETMKSDVYNEMAKATGTGKAPTAANFYSTYDQAVINYARTSAGDLNNREFNAMPLGTVTQMAMMNEPAVADITKRVIIPLIPPAGKDGYVDAGLVLAAIGGDRVSTIPQKVLAAKTYMESSAYMARMQVQAHVVGIDTSMITPSVSAPLGGLYGGRKTISADTNSLTDYYNKLAIHASYFKPNR